MYTNTPWDNHFKGTDPFLVTDPTVERTWLQKLIVPALYPLIVGCGLPANFITHGVGIITGDEVFSIGKLFVPIQLAILVSHWGWWGVLLMAVAIGTLGNYYFTCALMNHNAEHVMNVDRRNNSRDWGET